MSRGGGPKKRRRFCLYPGRNRVKHLYVLAQCISNGFISIYSGIYMGAWGGEVFLLRGQISPKVQEERSKVGTRGHLDFVRRQK